MKKFYLYSNGKSVEEKVLPEKFFNEDEIGIFESLRTYSGKFFKKEEHLQRFLESAHTAGVNNMNTSRLSAELDTALAAFRKEVKSSKAELFIRLNVFPDIMPGKIFIMIGERKHSADIYKKGVCLRTSPVRRSLLNAAPPEVKTSAYQNPLLASLEPSDGIYEWLFLDRNGFATEVRIGNLFIVPSGGARPGLATPHKIGILNGVTRRFVIECAHQAGFEVKEKPLTRHEIYNAAEAFLTNTSWEILPIRELDGRRIGRKIPGPVTAKLQKIFKQRVGSSS